MHDGKFCLGIMVHSAVGGAALGDHAGAADAAGMSTANSRAEEIYSNCLHLLAKDTPGEVAEFVLYRAGLDQCCCRRSSSRPSDGSEQNSPPALP